MPIQTHQIVNEAALTKLGTSAREKQSVINARLGRTVTGTRAAPIAITAGGGITASGFHDELIFVEGSGGAINITANPQIAAGTIVGQRLELVARSLTNTILIEFADSAGVDTNGDCLLGTDPALGHIAVLCLFWDGTNWMEEFRRPA